MTTTSAPPNAPAPSRGSTVWRWVKKNLFRTPFDSILSVAFGALAVYILFRALLFVFVNARWEIIEVNLKLLMVGRWPAEEMYVLSASIAVMGALGGVIAGWIAGNQIRAGTSSLEMMTTAQRISDLVRRFGLIIGITLLLLLLTNTAGPWLTAIAILVASIIGYFVGRLIGREKRSRPVTWTLVIILILLPVALLFFFMLPAVPLEEWEGFFFNITSAAAGIALSFPLGVLLALGRRSKLPLLRSMSIVYIEFVRGSPLFVLLLMANVSLEFFVPDALAPSKVVRAIVTFTLFSAAYIAEIVRGGLQSVPKGQEEAAKALGLSPTKQMFLIVLPQALRSVIPAQIGQFIALFKDTTLAGVALGILELLNVAQAITQQSDFRGQGLIIETLVFVAVMFWVGAFTMSRESQRLEKKLGVGTR